MLENRSLKRDLLALALLAAVIFLAAALSDLRPGRSARQARFSATQPAGERVRLLGRDGQPAGCSRRSASGRTTCWFRWRPSTWFCSCDATSVTSGSGAIGWLLSLFGFTTLAALAVPGLSPGPVIGAGGYLGVTGRALLQTHFASVGSYILSASMLLGGLLLSTDYCPGATVRLDRRQVDRKARPRRGPSQHGLRPEAQPTPLRSRRLRSRWKTTARSPFACRAGLPTEQDDEARCRSRARRATKDDEPAADGRKGPRLARRHQPAEAQGPTRGSQGTGRIGPAPESSRDYELPSLDLLLQGEPFSFEEQKKEVRRKAKILEKTFADFGFNVRVVEIQTGPVIAQFEVELEAGLRLSKITGLADDLAIALRVPSVPHRRPAAGQEHRRRRGAEQRAAARPSARGHGRGRRQGRKRCGFRSTSARTWPATRWSSI